ncbi:hypothetical protein [Stenomitos frigidus]|nr:hypothetical protein [Stenomitos frigidus]
MGRATINTVPSFFSTGKTKPLPQSARISLESGTVEEKRAIVLA